ncbi:MAG TPA: ATP-grasp domain-containing protein [Candidatus Babeliales bacterium]|nr:ATP-grasp domain-containing protein [Candidatus Babeliales bacterium]
MQKLRVGVLMGGRSSEREVSFNSGRTVCDHLDTSRYDIVPVFQKSDGTLWILPWHFLHRGKITDFEHRLPQEATAISWDALKSHIDFAYLAIPGRYAEDGCLQGFLDILAIPYLGSKLFASALCMDKTIQKDILRHHNIDTPKGITVYPHQLDIAANHITTLYEQLDAQNITLPYIVKPQSEGSSIAVTVVFDKADLADAILKAAHAHPELVQPVLIEERLQGMEFTCIVLTDYTTGKLLPLPPTEIVIEQGSHFFDYEQKYMPGRAHKFTPARCSQEITTRIQQTSMQTMQALEMKNFARIDGFVTPDNRICIIDPGTLSGMSPTSFLFREAAEINMSHTQLINHLIETELHAYGLLDAILTFEKENKKTMVTKKTRVAVLMGGDSNEREISLESGRNVVYKLSPLKYDVTPLFVTEGMELFPLTQSLLVRNTTSEIASALDRSTKIPWSDLPTITDFVFIGLHGGKGENGTVQGALEMLNVPYNGSGVLASSLCMDKFKTAQFLRTKGFETPQSQLIAKTDWAENLEHVLNGITATIPFPLIVKPHDDGCSVMVQKIKNCSELSAALDLLFAHQKEYALVEEYIFGMELTVGVIGNETAQALPPSQAITASEILSIEEKFLPGAGENQTPAPLPKQSLELVQRVMEGVYTAIGCKGYVRIDCFYQNAIQSPTQQERVIILEINTLPGMTPATCIFHQAAEIGLKPMDFVDLIVQLGLQAHTKQETLAASTSMLAEGKEEKSYN